MYASGRPEVAQSSKKLFAYLMRIPDFEGFLTSREFKLTLVEHDYDQLWTSTSESLWRGGPLPRPLGLLGEAGRHDRETLVWFVDYLLKLRKDKTLAFLDDVLVRFRHITSSRMNLDELKAVLSQSGYAADKISDMRLFSSVAETSKETVITDARPYDAYKQIDRIISSCKSELVIIDPWVDEDLFTLYLESVPASVSISIITKNMSNKFELVAKKFKQQRKQFEVKSSDIHDRYIIVDDRAWIVGQSIKDAGKRPLAIIELSDPSRAKDLFSKLWGTGKQIM